MELGNLRQLTAIASAMFTSGLEFPGLDQEFTVKPYNGTRGQARKRAKLKRKLKMQLKRQQEQERKKAQ